MRVPVNTTALHFSVLEIKLEATHIVSKSCDHWPTPSPTHAPFWKANQPDVSGDSTVWVQIPALGLFSCMRLDRFLTFLVPQFPHVEETLIVPSSPVRINKIISTQCFTWALRAHPHRCKEIGSHNLLINSPIVAKKTFFCLSTCLLSTTLTSAD